MMLLYTVKVDEELKRKMKAVKINWSEYIRGHSTENRVRGKKNCGKESSKRAGN